MNTPRVMKQQQQQQQRKSLSAKKGPVKGLRNVLAQPYDTHWPSLNKDEGSCLEDLLNRLLPGLKRQSQKIPWSQLRKMGKDERRAAREKLRLDSMEIENDGAIPKSITLGVNAVTRDLEKENLCSVLLDASVESLLIKHIVVMAQNKSIPILLVPFLKTVTLNKIGFASAAMGLKHEAIDASNTFHEIHHEIIKFAQAIPSKEKIESSQDKVESLIAKDEKMCMRDKKSSNAFFSLSTSVYKYRSTQKERIFVPPSLIEKMADDREDWGDFIAIGKDDMEIPTQKYFVPQKKQRYMDIHAAVDEKSPGKSVESNNFVPLHCNKAPPKVGKKKNNMTYLPLKVKRIQGNNNRVKATKSAKSKKKSTLKK